MLGGAEALSRAGDLGGARGARHAGAGHGSQGDPGAIAAAPRMLATYTDSLAERIAYQERALVGGWRRDRSARRDPLALFEHIASNAEAAARRADEAIGLLRDSRRPVGRSRSR